MKKLKVLYFEIACKFSSDTELISACFDEIYIHYSSKNRYYHNEAHLNALLIEIEEIKPLIQNLELVHLSMFYHDVFYDVLENDNEDKSADFALIHLTKLGFPHALSQEVVSAIMATKNHTISTNDDINYFTDADLSILGKSQEVYEKYCQKIRFEFINYPSFVFDKGRINVLTNMLQSHNLFKTDYFQRKYNDLSRKNIENEIKILKNKNYKFTNNNGQYVLYLEDDGDYSEFFYNAVDFLDSLNELEKIEYYPGFFDTGFYKMKYKGVKLTLEYEGMLGTSVRTEADCSEDSIIKADEIFKMLSTLTLSKEKLESIQLSIKTKQI